MDGENQFVENIMHASVVTIDIGMSARDAASMMADANVGCVVVTKDGRPMGIITERDLVRRVMVDGRPFGCAIPDVMSSPLITTDPDVPIWDLAQKMKSNAIHKIPVQKDGILIGIVTATDIVKAHSLASSTDLFKITQEILNRVR